MSENEALATVVAERSATRTGETVSGVEFVRSLGFDDLADEIEAARTAQSESVQNQT